MPPYVACRCRRSSPPMPPYVACKCRRSSARKPPYVPCRRRRSSPPMPPYVPCRCRRSSPPMPPYVPCRCRKSSARKPSAPPSTLQAPPSSAAQERVVEGPAASPPKAPDAPLAPRTPGPCPHAMHESCCSTVGGCGCSGCAYEPMLSSTAVEPGWRKPTPPLLGGTRV